MSNGRFYWVAGGCGAATGVIGAAFHLAVDELLHWPDWLAERLGTGPVAIAAAAAVAAIGITLAFILTRRFAPEASGSGVPEVEGALEGVRHVRWRRVLPIKFVGGVLALSSGLVAGREGPTIHMGASIGAALAEWLGLDEDDLHTLLAAGAAAGLSAAFNAPLAAVLFVIEETRKQFRYTFRSYVGVIVASAGSAFGMELVGGTAPPLRIVTDSVPLLMLPCFMILGVVLGVLGYVFNVVLVAAVEWRDHAFRRAPFVYALLVGAVVGALALVLPMAVGGGETLIPQMTTANLSIQALLLIAVVRFIGTMASYPVGVPAGIFSPMLTYATTIGLIGALLMEMALQSANLPVPPLLGPAFAVVAMGGLFSATIRAPLVGVVLAVELTGGYELILPLIVASVTAHVVAEALGGRPIYEVLLERTLRLAGRLPLVQPAAPSSPVGSDEPRRSGPG
ncbi:H(+)/Cl(-) exchange transporter ClcA [Reyranella sp.]|uniref:H(+)/Cl(-) exchange transporter ClcA n=1 Tax=Reyranella sp. TaxID=1929291 RepID=UPI003BAACA8D